MLNDQLNSDESRGLLSAIDKMRELLHGEKVALPEIVVVGDQSVGKSSVLEAISGIQLPRAQNICTRCPLELRMKSTGDKEYATIRSSVKPTVETQIDDLTKIADEVTRLTMEIAGTGYNVSSDPIYLTVYKKDIVYDLTLIDLPGITRYASHGQAENIHQQILDLINKYIEPSTAIVLHVIPASVDFTTSESMKLAKVFDPLCQRQLIAASKIDKYDKGIAEKLQGRGSGSMDLQLGCIAVLNRNQDEIDKNISFSEMKQREKQFFVTHKEAFEHLPDEYKGSEQLIRRLATIQQERIRSTFPDIMKKLRKQLEKKKKLLKKLPPPLNTEAQCWEMFQSMINVYRESIHDNVKGEYDQVASAEKTELMTTSENVETMSVDNNYIDLNDEEAEDDDQDHVAYHIYQLQRKFQKKCQTSFTNFFSKDYHKIVLHEIDRTAGVSLPNCPSYQIIVGLFRKELQKLLQCCHVLIEQMHEYISECSLRLFERAFSNSYSRLKERLKEIIIKKFSQVKEVLDERVIEILNMERRVFTLNHSYMDTVNKLKEKDNKQNEDRNESNTSPFVFITKVSSIPVTKTSSAAVAYSSVSNETQAAVDIQNALHAYATVVEKRVTDGIAQTCYYYFITQCVLKLDQVLSSAISPSQLIQYMREPHKQIYLRNNLTRSIQAYEEALQFGHQYM